MLDAALLVGERALEVGFEVPVLRVLVDEPVLVDMVVVDPVVLVTASELAGVEIGSTVFSDSTTNGLE